MANLLANFNSNLASSNPEMFSHSGFSQSQNVDQAETSAAVNFEDQMNQYCQMFFIGAMVLYLAYTQLSSGVLHGVQNKHGQNRNNGGNPPGGVL